MEKLWRCGEGMLEKKEDRIPIFSPRHLHNFYTSRLYTKNGDFNGKCKSQLPVAQ